jgi:hypothetical protein
MPNNPPQSIETIPCDADFSIRRDGTWLYEGTPITRPALVKLFSTILNRDDAGDYWLTTPVEQCRITVEDRPFVITAMEIENIGQHTQRLTFTSNIDQSIQLCQATPLMLDDVGPYIPLEKGLSARINRPVYYELAELAFNHGKQENGKLWLFSEDAWFTLGAI